MYRKGLFFFFDRAKEQIGSVVWEGGFHATECGFEPAVVRLIVADYRDLVFRVHQSLDLPEATSPIPRNDLCSA